MRHQAEDADQGSTGLWLSTHSIERNKLYWIPLYALHTICILIQTCHCIKLKSEGVKERDNPSNLVTLRSGAVERDVSNLME